ncbi:Ser/Thr protein kinase RdoA (MazF antagonist) [Nonomuraea rubra]|uniref:Ser/Thr protein kinase RdoA (MazF antagonist) n=1 Tax=Nonomuraea rubra TaxID=46180 RepID=A0A7X0P2G8_9ACTN|nr:Ser/Thr protein kinase RdoA (MazF antagonist) [Nonomuraea rubra]
MMVDELVAYAREAFGWGDGVAVGEPRRGALGQIRRVETGGAVYALKEIFGEPPPEDLVAAELAFARRAAGAGVRSPAGHPGLNGRYLVRTPAGTWLRLYDWLDLTPVDLTAPATPDRLGTLLARLHRCAPPATAEPGGRPPAPWYHRPPAPHEWEPALASGTAWAGPLRERLAAMPELCAATTPPDPGELIVCHRDLHPGNVLADRDGTLVVVDWDGLGPATPGRELARALFDWFSDPAPDLAAMRRMYGAYRREGGPGRVGAAADFSMLVASRLNFLLLQTRIATDPGAEPRHRAWAELEIDEALRIMPAPRQLAGALDALNGAETPTASAPRDD